MQRLRVQAVKDIQQQLAAQLEPLLWLAFKLDLQQLQCRVLRILRANLEPGGRSLLLYGHLTNATPETAAAQNPALVAAVTEPIFTPRVLAAAGSRSGREIFTRACLHEPLGRGFGIRGLFEQVDDGDGGYGHQHITFTAKLARDFQAFTAGTWVDVTFSQGGTLRMYATNAGTVPVSQYAFGVYVGPHDTFAGPGDPQTHSQEMHYGEY